MARDFSIRPPGGYELRNIFVNNQCISGELGDLLDNGNDHTQDSWVDFVKMSGLTLLTGEEYFAVMRTLYNHRNDPDLSGAVESLRQVFKQDFADYRMMTGSRLFIPAEGQDYVLHGIDREESRKVSGNLVGGDGFLSDHHAEFTRVLLGADVDEVNEIYGRWVNGRDAYAWKLPRKPEEGTIERPLVLGRGRVCAGIDAVGSSCVARGWAPIKREY